MLRLRCWDMGKDITYLFRYLGNIKTPMHAFLGEENGSSIELMSGSLIGTPLYFNPDSTGLTTFVKVNVSQLHL